MDNNISAVDAFLFEDGFQCVITVLRLVIKHKEAYLVRTFQFLFA